MVRWTVCLATPYASASAGMDGSRSPAPHSPARIRCAQRGRDLAVRVLRRARVDVIHLTNLAS